MKPAPHQRFLNVQNLITVIHRYLFLGGGGPPVGAAAFPVDLPASYPAVLSVQPDERRPRIGALMLCSIPGLRSSGFCVASSF